MWVQAIVVSPHTHITYNWERGHQKGRKEDGDKKRDGFCSTSVSQRQKQNIGEKRSVPVQMKVSKYCRNRELIACRRNKSD